MNKRLVTALNEAEKVARRNIVRSKDLKKNTLKILKDNKWLREIMAGWFILVPSIAEDGESTIWYTNFWSFLEIYLDESYGNDYCLNATSSVLLKVESGMIPKQVVVILKKGGARNLELPFETSVSFYQDAKNFPIDIEKYNGINIIELPKALTVVPKVFFENYELDAQLALKSITDISTISKHLVKSSQPVKANLLAGAYEFIGNQKYCDQIKEDMSLLSYDTKPENPFLRAKPMITNSKPEHPAVGRIEGLWNLYKESLIEDFPEPSMLGLESHIILEHINKIYVHDAYNSLSIEGYTVTKELIEKVARGDYNELLNEEDRKQEAALAAKGYNLAFKLVAAFIEENLGKDVEQISFENLVKKTYAQLFTPKVQAGMASTDLLVGYRNHFIFIRGSRHAPVNHSFISEVMVKYFELLDQEATIKAKILLSHFMLVYIHPFHDGNGRTARFVMNAILSVFGYNWTVISNENKKEYFACLEEASTNNNFEDFSKFIVKEMEASKKWQTIS